MADKQIRDSRGDRDETAPVDCNQRERKWDNTMSITPAQFNRVLGATNVVLGVGVGAFAIHEAATKDVSTKRTVQLGAGAVAMAGLGAALVAPQSKLFLPAMAAAAVGAWTYMGIGATNK